MSTPTKADRENIMASEHDTPPPAKVTRSEWQRSVIHNLGKHFETVYSEESERSDEDLSASIKFSGTDSDQSDSPAAESDRITPVPKLEFSDSDSSEETTQLASDHGDLLKNVEDISESSDSSCDSPERTNKSHELHEYCCGHPRSPPAGGELAASNKGYITPSSSQADRVASLRKQMAVYSPSDNILSPCTMKLNRLKNFFHMQQKTKNLSLSAGALSDNNDNTDDDDTNDAGATSDDESDKTDGEDNGSAESQGDSDHDNI